MNRMLMWVVIIPIFFIIQSNAFPQITSQTNPDSSQLIKTSEITKAALFSKSKTYPANVNTSVPPVTSEVPLSLFGFDLFNRDVSEFAFKSGEAFTLPQNYELGPGDRLGIYLLGKVQENIDVTVNVEGKIFLPPAGVIHVWGLSMSEFKKVLVKKLSQYYDNFNLDIMLLQPKNVLVAVVGDVIHPGKYVLSSLHTVLDAVIVAGGPTKKGSIRDIQLIRDGQSIASVDLYRFLMQGETKQDIFLQAGDKIRVPYAKEKVLVQGEINRPSIFELKPGANEKLSDLINLAGGFTEFAYLDKLEISRLQKNGHRTLLYANYNLIVKGDSTEDILLTNEDKIMVYSKLDQIHDREVAIYGEIRNPGKYLFEDNMYLSDLILKAGSLTRKAYTLEAEIAKINPGEPTKFLKVSLEQLNSGVNGEADIILEEDDQVFIRQIPKWEVGLTVDVNGEVMFPGKYSIIKDSTYLSTILKKAGGFTKDAFLQEAIVIRPGTRVRYDKEFERLQDMRREEMSDLEYQYFVMRQNSADVERIVVDFEKLVYEQDKSQDIILEKGDVIVVPRAPSVVTITGSVATPGGVTYKEGAKLSYYLAKAGGASWDANLRKTKVVKVTGEVLDDEDVKSFEAGDIIWVPRKSDKSIWPTVLQTITVIAQLASIYLIVDTAINRN